jgi:hypothetical protein
VTLTDGSPDEGLLANADRLPGEVLPVLRAHRHALHAALGTNLIGIYVHGSAALGGFTFAHSDLDYIAVVKRPLSRRARHVMSTWFTEHFDQLAPGGGIEMSVVQEQCAGIGFVHPTPYEFHMGTRAQVTLHGKPHAQVMCDPDLAAHFVVIRQRGLCVYGKPIAQVFTGATERAFFASVASDCAASYARILETTPIRERCRVPRYAVLNFCRTLAYLVKGQVLSKFEGAAWAHHALPAQFHVLIAAACAEQREAGTSEWVDPKQLRQFATYAQRRIQTRLTRLELNATMHAG